MHEVASELEFALTVIRRAADEVMRRYATFARIADAPADISTSVDRASQEIILQGLHEAFPDDSLCGEETTATLAAARRGGRRLWIVDPIDGTRGFAMKNDEFSIMIGLVIDGAVALGVVAEPACDRLTYAVRGIGCFVRQPSAAAAVRCHVRTTDSLKDAVMSISRSQRAEGEAKLLRAFGAARAVQTYSAGIKLAQVARGDTDLYLGDYLTLKDWDVCAGHVLVEEAGGTVTNVIGECIRYDGTGNSLGGKGLLATNGRLHAPALDVLRTGRYTF